jgi:hypothetical protein
MNRPRLLALLSAVPAAFLVLAAAAGQESTRLAPPEGFESFALITVKAGPAWTDTGLEASAGQELWFDASGTVSLQKDNPVASCGPEGMSYRTRQQPLPDRNLGCLVGKSRQKVEVLEDKDTKEKTIREFGEVFYIGKGGTVTVPVAGRLLLGVNENVTGDNEGAFEVRIFRRKA